MVNHHVYHPSSGPFSTPTCGASWKSPVIPAAVEAHLPRWCLSNRDLHGKVVDLIGVLRRHWEAGGRWDFQLTALHLRLRRFSDCCKNISASCIPNYYTMNNIWFYKSELTIANLPKSENGIGSSCFHGRWPSLDGTALDPGIYIYIHIYIYAYIYIYVYTYIHTHICVYTYIYIYVLCVLCVCMFSCIYI